MHWIIYGMMFILTQPSTFHIRNNYPDVLVQLKRWQIEKGVSASPVPTEPPLRIINPYIRHWQPAQFDRAILDAAHLHHEAMHRKKRSINYDSTSNDYGPPNIIKLNFFAHDKQFNLVLREDPNSIFTPDVEILNTDGMIPYDRSRVYTGKLEDDENSIVHGILTADNLFDGTITTHLEHYYIEPSRKYSSDLHNSGVHSIVYKTSDVLQPPTLNAFKSAISLGHIAESNGDYCASERLSKKIKNEFKRRRKWNDVDEMLDKSFHKVRRKRWLPEEISDSRNPPLPLDLDVPYNDDFNIFSRSNNNNNNNNDGDISRSGISIGNTDRTELSGGDDQDMYPNDDGYHNYGIPSSASTTNFKTNINRNKNILINDYNPNTDYNLRNTNGNRNIIVNTYDSSTKRTNGLTGRYNNNTLSRPSHKTHVEIITKNGATKKPHIIVNNYEPDVILTSTNFHHTNINLNVRQDVSDSRASHLYDRKSTCMLYLQADHTFFQKLGSDEASIEAITRHVQRANVIYKSTDFNGDGKPDNITFMIKRIKVHNMNALKDPGYRFPGNYGVEKFLELFSEEDYDAFCLAYMFTYRDFEMGTLGLAWTGDLKNAGGVCEKNGHYRGSLKSLNTGIVTLLNYGKHVPPAVSHVTLAHEIGHNFGSPHDPDQCTPGGEDGNYIMFARATSGDKRNNNKFSPCSLKAIEPVLNAKARSPKGCFTEPQQAICGNGVVDPGEQCDCGWETDCEDSCCYPMSRHPRLDEKPCTLTPRSKCSPSQGPCCTINCALKFGDKCRDDNGCRDPSFCDGRTAHCPASINKPNKTICNKEFVCYMGECTGSICLAYGLESCQCLPGTNDPKTKACELCCKLPDDDHSCKSSFDWNEVPYDVPDMFAKPGTPCNDYNGYCDVFQKCREVDPSGPLATLRKILLSEESIATFRKWITTNWYSVVLIILVIIALLVLSSKLLGKGTSLKKKTVTIIHSATTETVRLPDDNNGVIVHTAIRSKVPFKKKVQVHRAKSKSKIPSATKKPVPNSASGKLSVVATGQKVVKRSSKTVDSPKKVVKKKKRILGGGTNNNEEKVATVSAPTVPANKTVPNLLVSDKSKKLKKSKTSHKEIIDYSNRGETQTNTFGKVHKWLLESPIVQSQLTNINHTVNGKSSNIRNIIPKSQSTPEQLTQRSPKRVKSVSNLNDKVKLQVVYKPPFKFSLKLSKNSAVKTKVIGAGIRRDKRKVNRNDKERGKGPRQIVDGSKGRRTALLIRTTSKDEAEPSKMSKDQPQQIVNDTDHVDGMKLVDEPTYETLSKKPMEVPLYENLSNKLDLPAAPINTATFRISKSSSGSNLRRNYSASNSLSSSEKTPKSLNRNSTSNLQLIDRSSTINLSQPFGGSTQNLIRSSTTNLSKATAKHRNSFDIKRSSNDLNRSSTTNLTKTRHHGSHVNLRQRGSTNNLIGELDRNSRRNSYADNFTKTTNIPRIPSNSNLKHGRHGSITNNIPRINSCNVSNGFGRQVSLQAPSTRVSRQLSHPEKNRPHTADCSDTIKDSFEWPTIVSNNLNSEDVMPSDLEVMVSDVENLVNSQ